MSAERERILFVELWRLGDAVSATAGLRALRIARPNAEIGVLAHSRHGDPLFRSSDADQRLRFDAFWTRGQTPRDKYLPWTIDYAEVYRAMRAIHAFRPHHVLLFRGDIREQMMFRALGSPNIVDLKGPMPILPGIRTHARPAGVPRWREYVFHVQQWSRTEVRAEPNLDGLEPIPGSDPYLLLHPGASWSFKQWGVNNVVMLIRWLVAHDYRLKIVAGPGDRSFIHELNKACGRELAVDYPSLDELYVLIAGARAVICNNSAAMHIAEALHRPCIALTGPSDPVRWGIYRSHSRTVIRSEGLACHPCGEKRCVLPHAPCIDRIVLSDVLQALDDAGITSAISVGQSR